MNRHFAHACPILAVFVLSACAPAFGPYAGGPSPYPFVRPSSMNAMDPAGAARGRWDLVMRLPVSSTIDVLTRDGAAQVGELMRADAYAVQVMVRGLEQDIARKDVVRIDLVALPGSDAAAVAKHVAGGALAGAVIVSVIAAAIGGPAWPPRPPALRTGAVLGGVSAAQATLADRRPRLIYLAEHL